jgi:hypothetical protein
MRKTLAVLGLLGSILLSGQARAHDVSLDGKWALQESEVIKAIEATYRMPIGFFDFESKQGVLLDRSAVLHSTNNAYTVLVRFAVQTANTPVHCTLRVQADSQMTPLALGDCYSTKVSKQVVEALLPNRELNQAFGSVKAIESADASKQELGLRPSEYRNQYQQ